MPFIPLLEGCEIKCLEYCHFDGELCALLLRCRNVQHILFGCKNSSNQVNYWFHYLADSW